MVNIDQVKTAEDAAAIAAAAPERKTADVRAHGEMLCVSDRVVIAGIIAAVPHPVMAERASDKTPQRRLRSRRAVDYIDEPDVLSIIAEQGKEIGEMQAMLDAGI